MNIVWHYQRMDTWTGGTKFVYKVASEFAKQHQVTILTNNLSSDIYKTFKQQNIAVIVTYHWFHSSILHWLTLPIGIVIDTIRSHRFFKNADIIMATAYPSNIVTWLHYILTRKPYYYYCYEPFGVFFNQTLRKEITPLLRVQYAALSLIFKWSDIIGVRHAKNVFTLTHTTAQEIRKAYNVSSVITQAGVDTDLFRTYPNNPFQQTYQGKHLIVHSTDYSQIKRTDLAIRVVATLASANPSIKMVITSTNPQSPRLQEYIKLAELYKVKSNIDFMGFLSFKDLPKLYAAATVYLSCAYNLSHGVTSTNLPVKEAMACQVPVIRAPLDNHDTDVEDGISGYLVDPRQVDVVSQKIQYLIDNPVVRLEMGKEARKKVIQQYNWPNVASLIMDTIKQ